jgi:phosphate transport system permease protein
MASSLDQGTSIKTLSITSPGGGIRGSLLSTLLMIFFTLLLALPLGILGAVYLNQYAKDNRMNHLIRKMIDAAGGIPSIIYGLVGALIFIPLVNSVTKGEGGSLLSGAMTLAIMLLPTIISSTEEALKTIPASYAAASLALGASKTQTVFKVILPNATPGILTAVLLSIGRIIGESAALIYSCSTAIKDQILLTGGSATLAIHIWSLMGQENPDYSAAAGVALIILIADLLLNLTVKIIMSRFSRRFRKES